MAKQYNSAAANVPVKATSQVKEFSPEWIEINKAKLMDIAQKDLGIKLVTPAELDAMSNKKSEVELAAAELGIDFDKSTRHADSRDVIDVTDFVNKVAAQIDILYTSTQWHSIMSRKNKCALHAVRVFIRQLRNESAPPGQAATIADLVGAGPSFPRGALGSVSGNAKRIRVTDAHLKAAGILPNGVNLGSGVGPAPGDLDD